MEEISVVGRKVLMSYIAVKLLKIYPTYVALAGGLVKPLNTEL